MSTNYQRNLAVLRKCQLRHDRMEPPGYHNDYAYPDDEEDRARREEWKLERQIEEREGDYP